MDSGFFVLKYIIELKKLGIFRSSPIKKRRYWPKHVKGEDVEDNFKGNLLDSFMH